MHKCMKIRTEHVHSQEYIHTVHTEITGVELFLPCSQDDKQFFEDLLNIADATDIDFRFHRICCVQLVIYICNICISRKNIKF